MSGLTNYNYGGCQSVGKLRYREASDYDVYMEHLENPVHPSFELVKRIGSKNAWIVHDTANGLYCCQSYDTIVSVEIGGESVDLGRWSNSTTRHQGEFRRWVDSRK